LSREQDNTHWLASTNGANGISGKLLAVVIGSHPNSDSASFQIRQHCVMDAPVRTKASAPALANLRFAEDGDKE
jgi:hypothetical protein